MAGSEEELKSLLMKVKEESKTVGLKLNVQKNKIMASSPITSWQIDGETVADFIFFLAPKSLQMVIAAMKLKDTFWHKSYDQHSTLKSKNVTLSTKVRLVKAMVFPVVMYGCESWTIKRAEHRRIDAFELWCWRRPLRVPWIAGRSNQSIILGVHWKD